MKRKFTKKQIMESYYSDEELREMMSTTLKQTLRWLEETNRFFNKVLPRETKKLQEKLILEGW